MPMAVRSHFPSSRRSVSTGAETTTDAGTVSLVIAMGFSIGASAVEWLSDRDVAACCTATISTPVTKLRDHACLGKSPLGRCTWCMNDGCQWVLRSWGAVPEPCRPCLVHKPGGMTMLFLLYC